MRATAVMRWESQSLGKKGRRRLQTSRVFELPYRTARDRTRAEVQQRTGTRLIVALMVPER
jgi:hypothetical protein